MKSRIKILYLIGQLGLGGSEKQLYILLKHIDKIRFEPHVVVFNRSANYTLDEDLRQAGVPVYAMPETRRNVLSRLIWLVRLAKQLRPDIIHSWTLHDNAYAALVGIIVGTRVRLGSLRGRLAAIGFVDAPVWIRWLILHGVQGHLVNSSQGVDDLRAVGVSMKRIQMLPNCVEIPLSANKPDVNSKKYWMPDRACPGLRSGARHDGMGNLKCRFNDSDVRRIGMVGNLRREKNYPLFLRGLSLVLPEFPNLLGVMVGQPILPSDAEVPAQIQSEIDRLGLGDHITQAGFRADVPAFLANWEIFCLTSNSEGMPNAVLEAMAAGLPVVASRVGGIPQVVEHGVTGLLFPPGDENAFADALRQLLNDPERAQSMGAAGQQKVTSEFSPQVILPMFESYYLEQFH
jgi:glycosyltransferase involved in cell wall biosynthesis